MRKDFISSVMYFGFMVAPMIYLIFHGWANKNLIDTTVYDSLAKFLFIVSMVGSLTAYFLYKG